MTKEEAQIILDAIDPETVVDDNWLDSLISENKEYTKLRALSIITEKTWNEIISCYEGEYITKFQTKKEIYVGKTIKPLDRFYLIVAQDELYFYYIDTHGKLKWVSLNDVNNYLI
jgi:hypothetical protein